MQIVCVSEILNNNSLMDKAKEEKWPFLKVYLHDTTATVTFFLMRTLSVISIEPILIGTVTPPF